MHFYLVILPDGYKIVLYKQTKSFFKPMLLVFSFVTRFDEKENVSNCIQLKTSVIKGIKNQLLEQFPDIESWLNQIMPKKDPVKIVRWYLPFHYVIIYSISSY